MTITATLFTDTGERTVECACLDATHIPCYEIRLSPEGENFPCLVIALGVKGWVGTYYDHNGKKSPATVVSVRDRHTGQRHVAAVIAEGTLHVPEEDLRS